MKRLLIVTAVIVAGAGLALMTAPSVTVNLLLGSPVHPPDVPTMGRLTGAVLRDLGFANWLASCHGQGRTATSTIAGMTVYNIGAEGVRY